MSDAPTPRMRYRAYPAVSIAISHPENRFGRLHDDGGFIRRFRDFCDEQGWLLEAITAGPGILSAVLVPINAESMIQEGAADTACALVDKWLTDNGAEDACLRCGSKGNAPHDETKH
jgi:hypothetical protein